MWGLVGKDATFPLLWCVNIIRDVGFAYESHQCLCVRFFWNVYLFVSFHHVALKSPHTKYMTLVPYCLYYVNMSLYELDVFEIIMQNITNQILHWCKFGAFELNHISHSHKWNMIRLPKLLIIPLDDLYKILDRFLL